jgi:hypothetical protein
MPGSSLSLMAVKQRAKGFFNELRKTGKLTGHMAHPIKLTLR